MAPFESKLQTSNSLPISVPFHWAVQADQGATARGPRRTARKKIKIMFLDSHMDILDNMNLVFDQTSLDQFYKHALKVTWFRH